MDARHENAVLMIDLFVRQRVLGGRQRSKRFGHQPGGRRREIRIVPSGRMNAIEILHEQLGLEMRQ